MVGRMPVNRRMLGTCLGGQNYNERQTMGLFRWVNLKNKKLKTKNYESE
jgi:hypothetical protein